jgi:hypothetical protein
MNVQSKASGTQRAVGLGEMAVAAALGLTTLTMCSLMTGCSLTHVEARPAPSIASVSVVGVESGFSMSSEEHARLSKDLTTSLGARGHTIAETRDAQCHVVALVERDYHRTSVSGSMHSTTDYEYGTYRVRLIALDLDGKQIGEAHTERDVFINEMETHPDREEKVIVDGIRRAADALFTAPARPDLRMMSASR